jgi:molybdopterin-containing oxidoreductase family iron-sulfur binding subunit
MPSLENKHIDADAAAPRYWRSVAQLTGSADVERYIENEFPGLQMPAGATDRRQFLRLFGASLALAGITSTGCRRWPVEEVRPHTSRPNGHVPGVAQYYATAFELDGVATGLLAKSYDGRPIKIEGSPDHPFSLGAASLLAQASVLELYDPDRSRSPQTSDSQARKRATWEDFQSFSRPHFQALRERQGEGLAILSQPSSSPSWDRLRVIATERFPKARWFEFHPLDRDNVWAGSLAAFGRALRCQYELQRASVIVAFEADLLGSHPAHLKLARDWAVGRSSADEGRMNRMYVIEPSLSVTGSVADYRLPLKPTLIESAVAYVAYRFGILSTKPSGLSRDETELLERAAADLHRARDTGLIVAGPAQSGETHRLIHAINDKLGSVGQTVWYSEEPLARATPGREQMHELSELLQGDVLNTLLIVGGNPVYDAPADLPLNLRSDSARKLVSIHLSLYDNETSQACTWHLPSAHFLECWGDGRAWDGTYTLQQPLILPLYDGKSPIELLALLSDQPTTNGLELVRATYEGLFPAAGQRGWELALHDGVQANSAFPGIDPPPVAVEAAFVAPQPEARWEVRFAADSKTHDGRFANNAWLQELPEPLTKLTWDNAALISQADADDVNVATGDRIRLSSSDPPASVEVPAFVMPGQAAGCITFSLGYGRSHAGHLGNGVGVNAYPLRLARNSYLRTDCELAKTGTSVRMVTTQEHGLLDPVARDAYLQRIGERSKPGMLVHETTLDEYQRHPASVHGSSHAMHAAPLYDSPSRFDSPHKWGMSIDLNACIGCSACVVACQAENNVPVVGKANVANNREMHWLRIDRYFKGEVGQPDVVHVPMACAHCENAPCEQVCPVAATVHDSEGLNSMVYNRCIGTRYCANNCPYKVRRFNYFDYQAADPKTPAKPWIGIPDQQQPQDVSPLKRMVHNPDVTVRMRGVMEKCTYCVQRIVDGRISAKNQHAMGTRASDLVADGEVQTACQATCPTKAIVFGDLNDPHSAVSRAKANSRSYALLDGQNLGTRTTYLAKLRNRGSEKEGTT